MQRSSLPWSRQKPLERSLPVPALCLNSRLGTPKQGVFTLVSSEYRAYVQCLNSVVGAVLGHQV